LELAVVVFYGGLPALLAVFVRYRVKESEIWQKARPACKWGDMLRAIARRNWKLLLYLTLLMTCMNFASHGTQDLYPSFLEQQRHLNKNQVANIVILSNVGAIFGGVAFGFLSDRRGRRFGMALAFILAALMIPLWSSGTTTVLLCLGGFLMQFMVQGAWGIIPAHINELSPDSVRGFLPGFAYQCGVLLASNSARFEAQFAKNGSYSSAMATVALAVFVVGTIVIISGPERRLATFGAG
jgi:MFS transporter, SHS family, lactate transporter